MAVRVATVAFEGVEARPVDVQVQISPGSVVFNVVGLADKAVAESRERVRAALIASGLALPAKRITVNLAPADMPKEGSHYDLPIALGVMAAIGALPSDALEGYVVLGELALDGALTPVAGVLPAAVAANARGQGLICPQECGPEAAWASRDMDVLAPRSLIQLVNHVKGPQVLARPEPAVRALAAALPDLSEIKGQESAKRALEIAAAGGHNLLILGSSRPSAGPVRFRLLRKGFQAAEVTIGCAIARKLTRRTPRQVERPLSPPALVRRAYKARNQGAKNCYRHSGSSKKQACYSK